MASCDCIASGNVNKPKRHNADAHAKDCAIYNRRNHVAGCPTCDRYKPREMFPPHDASYRCESGGYNHCTCDTCF